MRITPLDVRKQDFRKAVRGFDCDEVRAFLTTLADEYETVLIDNKQLRETVLSHEEKLVEYQGMETTLRDTLMTAERVMQETKETATHRGEVIIEEAHLKAKSILEECRIRTEELRREIVGLRKEKEIYLARFRSLAQAQIQFVDAHESDFEDLDRRMVDIVDSVVEGLDTRPGSLLEPRGDSAPRPVAAQLAPPVQEPVGPSAPVEDKVPAPGGVDIWRNYNPTDNAPEASVATPTVEEASAEADEIVDSIARMEETAGPIVAQAPVATQGTPAGESEEAVKEPAEAPQPEPIII